MSRVRADPITAALAHPTRRNVYISLTNSPEMSTVQLQNLVDVDRYNLYHHLKKLAALGLVENHRDEGRARWWKVANVVDLPELLTTSNQPKIQPTGNNEPVNLEDHNTHVISLAFKKLPPTQMKMLVTVPHVPQYLPEHLLLKE